MRCTLLPKNDRAASKKLPWYCIGSRGARLESGAHLIDRVSLARMEGLSSQTDIAASKGRHARRARGILAHVFILNRRLCAMSGAEHAQALNPGGRGE